MNGLLRDLHPEQDLQQYEVLSLWDLYPDANPVRPGVRIEPLPDYAALTQEAKDRAKPCQRTLAAWLTKTPRTARQAAADLGISYSAAQHQLSRLAMAGKCERTWEPGQFRRRPVIRYARGK